MSQLTSAAQLSFDPEVGLVAPGAETIRLAIQEDWQTAFGGADASPALNVEATTPAGQLIDAQAAEIEAKNAELLYLASMFNPRVADGRWQDALGQIYFLTRKIAESTVVTCQLTGLYNTVVPYGAQVKNADGYTLVCTRAVRIGSDGTAETTFRVSETGPIAIPANSVTKIITVTAGWDSVNNAAAGATGRDVETRAEFEARRYASVAANAHGSVAAMYGLIANVPGVIDCSILENVTNEEVTQYGIAVGAHSVAVCVYGGESADIAEAIYRKKDAGCGASGNTQVSYTDPDIGVAYTYRIVVPSTINFNVKVVLPNAASLSAATIQAVKEAVAADFLGQSAVSGNARVGLASTVYASRFYSSVLAVEGVSQLNTITVALGSGAFASSVTINADQEPVITTENVTVTAS